MTPAQLLSGRLIPGGLLRPSTWGPFVLAVLVLAAVRASALTEADDANVLLGIVGASLPSQLSTWSDTSPCTTVELPGSIVLTSGYLDDNIGFLDSLERLSLSGAGISGLPLPDAFSDLTGLTYLSLSANSFTTGAPPSWSVLTGLRSLLLGSSVSLAVPGSGGPWAEWSTLTALESLSLRDQGLSGGLPAEWASLTALTLMDLSGNALTGGLPPAWSALASLDSLLLYDNILTGPLPLVWLNHDPSELYMVQMRYLDLSRNSLDGVIPAWQAHTVSSSRKLQPGPLLEPVSLPLWQTSARYVLDLSYNVLTGGVPAELWAHPLFAVHLQHNALNGNLAGLLAMAGCTSLQTLNLAGNALSGELANFRECAAGPKQRSGSVPDSWLGTAATDHMRLERFDCEDCTLTGLLPAWGDPYLPSDVPLKALSLSSNALGSGGIPAFYSAFTQLTRLELADNGIFDALPTWPMSLESLRHLDLSGNFLTGSIVTYGRTALSYLDLSNNTLDGALPANGLGASLRHLYVEDNILTGGIPTTYSNAKFCFNAANNADMCGAANNLLTGALPAAYSALTGLQNLYAQGNRLAGPLPGAWTTGPLLLVIRELHVSGNNLSAAIPSSWAALNPDGPGTLQCLDLYDNPYLCGEVPAGMVCPEANNTDLGRDCATRVSTGSIVCVEYRDTACPRQEGYVFYPYPLNSIVPETVLYTLNTTNSATASAVAAECRATPGCVAFSMSSVGNSLMAGYIDGFQKLMQLPAAVPQQFMCFAELEVQASLISTTTGSGASCESQCRAASSPAACDVFTVGNFNATTGEFQCRLRTGAWSSRGTGAYAVGSAAAGSVTCFKSNDPWLCLPDGYNIPGTDLANQPTTVVSAEVCANSCLFNDCSAYLYSPTAGTCTLRKNAFKLGAQGAAAAATDPMQRSCLKTAQNAYSGSFFWSQLCYSGVSLGGSVVATYASYDVPSCASLCAAWGAVSCSHIHVLASGDCQLRLWPFDVNLNSSSISSFGTDGTVAAACMPTAGQFECLPLGYTLRLTWVDSGSGYSTLESCASWCTSTTGCELFAYDSSTTICYTAQNAFVGSQSFNGRTYNPNAESPQLTAPTIRYCLRTLNLRQPLGYTPAAEPTAEPTAKPTSDW
ncbi:Leucine-rich repeat receptor-like protein kinase PXL2 [Tetrabaena socialis]|uniref:Leucine-rich repeat receptor-like protein kinase PXL2 n=1 Tax=Tetrabaena socialis TaxID=47790 RepID=A0A2J8A820_9CHLO|nr:Leucine-rich repeat receptor-like protein kinase PXL2 [Tetrabaena socialis]|eukprot:PNH08674.1 Leucine-rich repeat receptor-like protein kinase PXL2 [Tetrabaena socialis]